MSMTKLSKPTLVIFDCDGVIVDSEALAGDVFWKQLTRLGWTLDLHDTTKLFIGRSLKDCFKRAEAELGTRLPNDFESNLQKETFAVFESDLAQMPGVDCLARLLTHMEIEYCVASSGSYEKMSTTLGITELALLFPRRFSSSEVERGKPAPDLFLHASKALGHAPDRCWVIEDSSAGITAALQAGMTAIKLGGDKMVGAHHVTTHFELVNILKEME